MPLPCPPLPRPLLMLACSATKLDHPAQAIELYQGVMYTTLAKHMHLDRAPHIVILSAEHGFIAPDKFIEPYNRRMTQERAAQMLCTLSDFASPELWPTHVGCTLLAGGLHYRRVMRAMLSVICPEGLTTVRETTGGIGLQRAQLGAFLRSLAPTFAEQIGAHPNGTPLFRRYGQFSVGDTVALKEPGRRGAMPKRAVLNELFAGPAGPTACADVEYLIAGRPRTVSRWISLRDVHVPSSRVGQPPPYAGSDGRIGDAAGLSGDSTFSI